jgi:hypothetical protein
MSYKSQHTILIKSAHPKGLSEFFSRLFWKDAAMIESAVKVYNMIKDGTFNEKKRDEVMKETGLTYGQYYHLLKCLKSLGLVRKEVNNYVLSNEFAERLQRLIEYATGVKDSNDA